MKIQILSDLHLERLNGIQYVDETEGDFYKTDADVCIFAGDIDSGKRGIDWAKRYSQDNKCKGIYVLGNHELYTKRFNEVLHLSREAAKKSDTKFSVEFLECDELIVDDVRFLGCSLWTDFNASNDFDFALARASQVLNDYRLISVPKVEINEWWPSGSVDSTWQYEPLKPEHTLAIHRLSREWLERKLSEDFNGKTVVITHHGPSPECQHPNYSVDAISANFWSDIEELMTYADVWVYGHSHANIDVYVNDCRLICNQRGYPFIENVAGFDPKLFIEI